MVICIAHSALINRARSCCFSKKVSDLNWTLLFELTIPVLFTSMPLPSVAPRGSFSDLHWPTCVYSAGSRLEVHSGQSAFAGNAFWPAARFFQPEEKLHWAALLKRSGKACQRIHHSPPVAAVLTWSLLLELVTGALESARAVLLLKLPELQTVPKSGGTVSASKPE